MIYDVFLCFEDFFGKMIGDSFRRPYFLQLESVPDVPLKLLLLHIPQDPWTGIFPYIYHIYSPFM